MSRAIAVALLAVAVCACQNADRSQPEAEVYERIVTLAPNLTELVFAVGAGDSLVGVSAWSDYPEQARAITVVGDAFMVDQEQLALLEPDLLLVWESGTPKHAVDELRKSGYVVETIRTRGLDDVSEALLRIGKLTGRSSAAEAVAADYRQALETLRESHRETTPINVFYQVSARPLYTVNREHYVSELIEICGGRNVFADLDKLAPGIAVEAVVERDPEVMLASTDAGDDAFEEWQRWPAVSANLYGNLFLLPADEVARATPRLVLAGGAMCLALQQARFNRDAISSR